MKLIRLPYFLLIFCSSILSQEISFSKGEIVKDRQFLKDKNEITVSDEKGNFISVRPQKDNGIIHDYFVEFFKDLNFTERIEIKTHNKTKILKVFIKNEKVHVFIKEEFGKEISLRFDIIDIHSKKLIQKKIFITDKETSPDFHKSLKDDFNISLEYSSKIILTIPIIKYKKTYTFVKIFSKNIEELKQHKIYPNKTLSQKYTRYLNTSQFKGKVYLLFNLTSNKGENIYRIIELDGEQEKTLDIPLKKNTYELISSKIKNSKLIISGLFSRKRKGGFEGVTNYRVDLESFSVSYQKQSYFFSNKISNYFKGFFNKNRSIDIKNICVDENLNTYLICQFYVIRKQQIPIGIPIATIGSSILITYNPVSIKYKLYDDLLICKMNLDGDLDWNKVIEFEKIEKTSSQSNKKDSSIFTFLFNDKINVFINGYINPKKEKILIKQDKKFSKTNFYNITINNEGYTYLKTVFPNSDSKIIFRAGKMVKSGNLLYNFGQGNMRKQLLKVKL